MFNIYSEALSGSEGGVSTIPGLTLGPAGAPIGVGHDHVGGGGMNGPGLGMRGGGASGKRGLVLKQPR